MANRDFKDQFVGINVSNFWPGCIQEKKINEIKVLGKKKAAAKALLKILANLHIQARLSWYKLHICTERQCKKEMYVFKNLLQFNER